MGDPLHSQPVSVIYGPGLRDGLLFVATNDGFLHALDISTGIEQWAFFPREFLDDQIELLTTTPPPRKHYAIDGPIRDPEGGRQRRHHRARQKGLPVRRHASRRRLLLRAGHQRTRRSAASVAPKKPRCRGSARVVAAGATRIEDRGRYGARDSSRSSSAAATRTTRTTTRRRRTPRATRSTSSTRTSGCSVARQQDAAATRIQRRGPLDELLVSK